MGLRLFEFTAAWLVLAKREECEFDGAWPCSYCNCWLFFLACFCWEMLLLLVLLPERWLTKLPF